MLNAFDDFLKREFMKPHELRVASHEKPDPLMPIGQMKLLLQLGGLGLKVLFSHE